MASRIDELMERMALLERELEYELNRARADWQYRIVAGRIRFERQAHLAHKRLKQRILTFLCQSSIPNALTTPLIFSLIVPIAILGDAEGYRRQLPVLRKALEKEHADDLEAGRGGRHS